MNHCDAFAATSLVENYSCRNNGKKSCDSLSTLDSISQIPGKMSTTGDIFDPENAMLGEGGRPVDDLEIIKKNGLCEDQYAPYNDFNNQVSVGSNHAMLNGAYLFYEMNLYESSVGCQESIANETIRIIREDMGLTQYDSEFIRARLQAAPNAREFVRMMIVPEECVKKRTKFDYKIGFLENTAGSGFKHRPVAKEAYGPDSTQESKLKKIIGSKLKKGVPLAMSFNCDGSGVCPTGATFNHAVVIKGMRKNPATGKCELLVHNSWGKSWQDSLDGGWVEATPLIERSFEYTWIE